MGLIDAAHRYSYSQLEQFDECPYSFYLQRIEDNKDKLVGNSFASQGTLIHDLIDQWAKGKLTRDQLVPEYKRRYPLEVENKWPRILASKGYAQKTYEQGLQYFEDFDEFEGYEIVTSEHRFTTRIHGRKFVGVVDMVLRDKTTGKMIILDHKSKSESSFKKAGEKMYRQQFLYSKWFKEKYKQFPDILMFNLFKEDGLKMSQPFDEAKYKEVLRWATETIEKIENYDLFDWYATKEGADEKPDFFCHEICSCRKMCPNGV
jgi:hypothetical protein